MVKKIMNFVMSHIYFSIAHVVFYEYLTNTVLLKLFFFRATQNSK